jgi:thiol:disulfide interchange protein DsbD
MVLAPLVRGAAWLVLAGLLAAGPTLAQTTTTRASLLLAAEAARPGDTVMAAVRLQMARGWHTYWRNPGESGKATEIVWKLPAGVTAGEIQWPPPETYTASEMTTYVYHDEVFLLVPLTLAGDLRPGPLDIQAEVDWLECEVACVPGSARLSARLEAGPENRTSPHAAAIAAWQARVPRPNLTLEARASWEANPSGDDATLIIEGNALSDFRPVDFYAYPADDFEVRPAVKVLSASEGRFRLSKQVNPFGKPLPTRVAGILVQAGRPGEPPRAVEVSLDLPAAGGAPAAATSAAGSGAADARSPAAKGSLLAMLGLAFLGGLILNIMPCVLPVIALKVLGFVQQSKEDPGRVRQLGLIYALGVLTSFLVLAGLVIQVQQAGGSASWGMQMQNPQFRVALLVVVTLVALNLFGVFEVMLPGRATDAAAGLAAKQGAAGAFFHGVLATALATPCTAPFLAVALGFAFTQPPAVVLLMFASVAMGLAFPYVVLSWRPGWLRFLPKPGLWMNRFKVAMGFPMLATAVWLLDFSAPGFGEGGLLWLGLFVVLLALAAWVWGEFVQRGGRRRGLAMAICAAVLLVDYVYVLEGQLRWRSPHTAAIAQDVIQEGPDGIPWHRWSPEAVEAARQAGRPVLVDFTAKWCLTCKSNKRFALEVPEVRSRLKILNVISFRADNTDPDPRIVAELKGYGRAGVPLVLVFPADIARPPIVLPELLTPGIVLEALERAAGPALAAGG